MGLQPPHHHRSAHTGRFRHLYYDLLFHLLCRQVQELKDLRELYDILSPVSVS